MRPLAHLRARLGGYFWKPCPRCGHMFGGHEIGGRLLVSPGLSKTTCRECPAEYVMYHGGIWRVTGHIGPAGLMPGLVDPVPPPSGLVVPKYEPA